MGKDHQSVLQGSPSREARKMSCFSSLKTLSPECFHVPADFSSPAAYQGNLSKGWTQEGLVQMLRTLQFMRHMATHDLVGPHFSCGLSLSPEEASDHTS